jgi:hypothetical protein
MDKREVDPIPEKFHSYEEAAEFWDTHDTTDYPEVFRTIEATTELHRRHFELEIDMSVASMLQKKARQQGVSVSKLASELLRRQLALTVASE